MPIGQTDETVSVCLDSDANAPEAERPTFLFRFPSARERAEVRKLINAAHAAPDDEQGMDLLDEAIGVTLAGWRNVTHRGRAVAHGADRPSSFLVVEQLWELAYSAVTRTRLTPQESFQSGSQQGSGPASTASTAPAAGA